MKCKIQDKVNRKEREREKGGRHRQADNTATHT